MTVKSHGFEVGNKPDSPFKVLRLGHSYVTLRTHFPLSSFDFFPYKFTSNWLQKLLRLATLVDCYSVEASQAMMFTHVLYQIWERSLSLNECYQFVTHHELFEIFVACQSAIHNKLRRLRRGKEAALRLFVAFPSVCAKATSINGRRRSRPNRLCSLKRWLTKYFGLRVVVPVPLPWLVYNQCDKIGRFLHLGQPFKAFGNN